MVRRALPPCLLVVEPSRRNMTRFTQRNIGFLLMGFTFMVPQDPTIREFLVAFYGNENSIGLILENWLLLKA
jgi:hypothetical protein